MVGQAATAIAVQFEGTWRVRSTSTAAYSGTYDVLEGARSGLARRTSGAVAGRLSGASTTEFDVAAGNFTRRHVGTLQADTVRGSWFDVTASGTVEASGTFRAVRR